MGRRVGDTGPVGACGRTDVRLGVAMADRQVRESPEGDGGRALSELDHLTACACGPWAGQEERVGQGGRCRTASEGQVQHAHRRSRYRLQAVYCTALYIVKVLYCAVQCCALCQLHASCHLSPHLVRRAHGRREGGEDVPHGLEGGRQRLLVQHEANQGAGGHLRGVGGGERRTRKAKAQWQRGGAG